MFKDIIGHKEIKQQLIATYKAERVSHAQLFSGKTGYGTLALALSYAQYIFCTGNKDEDACGVCPACIKVMRNLHPDLHFVFPVTKTRADKDALSEDNITQWRNLLSKGKYISLENWYSELNIDITKELKIYTEEGLNILQKLHRKPYESDYRIVIIWLPESMTTQCANKLLKIVEEPYEKTVFIMVSEEPEKLLSTIQSRLQKIIIPPLSAEQIKEKLTVNYGVSETHANKIAHIAQGDWCKAQNTLNETEEQIFNQESFEKLMRLCWERRMPAVNKWVADLSSLGREKQKIFIEHAIKMIRENFMRNFKLEELNYMTEREEKFSERFAPYINENNILALSNEFERAYSDIARNGNGKIILTDLCIKVMQNIRPT